MATQAAEKSIYNPRYRNNNLKVQTGEMYDLKSLHFLSDADWTQNTSTGFIPYIWRLKGISMDHLSLWKKQSN